MVDLSREPPFFFADALFALFQEWIVSLFFYRVRYSLLQVDFCRLHISIRKSLARFVYVASFVFMLTGQNLSPDPTVRKANCSHTLVHAVRSSALVYFSWTGVP